MAKGRDQLVSILQEDLKQILERDPTKKDAEAVLDVVIKGIEKTLVLNLDVNGFSLKLNRFAKLVVQHKEGILRKIPFSGITTITKDKRKIKFITLGALRAKEVVEKQ